MNSSQNISPKRYILEALDRLPEAVLSEIASFVRFKEKEETAPALSDKDELLLSLAKPIKKKTDIEALAKEQGYKPTSIEEWNELLKDFESEEPLKELLAQLD